MRMQFFDKTKVCVVTTRVALSANLKMVIKFVSQLYKRYKQKRNKKGALYGQSHKIKLDFWLSQPWFLTIKHMNRFMDP